MPVKMTIGIVGNNVEITETSNKKGGNVRTRAFQRLVWEKDASVKKFTLKFKRIDDGDGAVDTQDDWPFFAEAAKPSITAVDEFACTVTDVTKFAARLAVESGLFKYSVVATPDPVGQDVTLDPVIIVGR
jgi:hypothetical protein